MNRERRRLTLALLLSLLIHALLLRLTFSGQGLGLPGFAFPWRHQRIEVPQLRAVLVPAQVTAAEPAVTPVAEPLQQASVEQPVAGGLAPSVSPAPTPRRTAAAIVPQADPSEESNPGTHTATGAAPAEAPLPADRPADTAPPSIPESAVIALTRSDEATWVVSAAPAMPTPAIEAAPSASSPGTTTPPLREDGDAARVRIDQEERERAVELARLDSARQEAQRQAEQIEAARQEAARREAARAETARLEAERQAAARQEAVREEAVRQEAVRQEAVRQEAARLEAKRQEAEREAAERQEAAAKREAVLRAIGRQLDEEAARRKAASDEARLSPSLPYSYSSPRRARLFGRSDPNAELVLYAEAWSRKIQLNMTFEMVREAAKLPHTDPMVTVAVRSDGSVESVTFVVSSGVAAVDEAIRRIVHSQEHYQAFPERMAREFDVIEIRRTWHFDVAIRLY